MYRCITYFNCLNQNWASEIAFRGFFLVFFWGGVSLIICDEPRYNNVFFSFLCFLQRPLQLGFYTYLSKQKRNTKSSSNPFNAKISFEAYLHIPVYKDEEGHYES